MAANAKRTDRSWTKLEACDRRRISFLGPFRSCLLQFEAPRHLEWLVRRLSASPSRGSQGFAGGRFVCVCRRDLRFCGVAGGGKKRRLVS